MTSESSQQQETNPEAGQAQTRETDEPNEFGFSGGATAPEPQRESAGEGFGESVAVPAGDLTGAITQAIEEQTTNEDER